MDLLSSIRKEGSRGGVNFQWSDVASSSHRENYLGHSLMAPVGRWQKGKDLNWYAKADDKSAIEGETDEEKQKRLRMEEIKKIKEAEEDAMNKALGLPPIDRTANAMPLGAPNRMSEIETPLEGAAQYKGLGASVARRGNGPAEPERRRNDDKDDRDRSHRYRRHRSRRDRSRSKSEDRGYDKERRRHRDTRERCRSRSPPRRSHRNDDDSGYRRLSRERRHNPYSIDDESQRKDRSLRDDRELRRHRD